jgi:pyruvate kinase
MCLAGMNTARMNFSHGTHDEQKQRIDRVKKVRAELDLPVAIMLDTKGPEFRIGTFRDGTVMLSEGDTFTFTTKDVVGTKDRVAVSFSGLTSSLEIGDQILVNNGLLIFEVKKLTKTDAVCTVVCGGEISDRKSMSFPNKTIRQEYLSEQDKSDLLFGIANDVDYVAASFVSTKQNLLDLKAFLEENGGGDVAIIAKIENRTGINNIKEICEECEGIMIGRGDLGVEVPFEELPYIQKYLVTECRLLGKRVITATEMLESMIHSPRPTRAEISDVANAVYDGTSAVMLSGETAAGKYPVESVQTMAKIAEETEQHIHYDKRFRITEFHIKNTVDAISHATCGMAIDLDADGIIACTLTGMTARMISRFRPPVGIIGLTPNRKVWYKLSLSWGVIPVMSGMFTSTDVLFYHATETAKKVFGLKPDNHIIITGGYVNGVSGNTSLIKIETI